MAKLFLMGVAEVRPSRFEPRASLHGSIYDNLLTEAEEADEMTEPSEAPTHLGWLDDDERPIPRAVVARKMGPWPGIEPGLAEPQSAVLTPTPPQP